MKIDINIRDLTEAQAQDVMKKLSCSKSSDDETISEFPVVITPNPVISGTPAEYPVFSGFEIESAEANNFERTDFEVTHKTTINTTCELDSEGLPWDERIHSSSKKKKADGTWTRVRGIQDAQFEEVKNELKAKMATGTGIPATPPVQEAPAAPAIPPMVATVTQIPQVMTQPVSRDFSLLMTRIQNGIMAGTVNPALLQEIAVEINNERGVQLRQIIDVSNNPELTEFAHQKFDLKGIA